MSNLQPTLLFFYQCQVSTPCRSTLQTKPSSLSALHLMMKKEESMLQAVEAWAWKRMEKISWKAIDLLSTIGERYLRKIDQWLRSSTVWRNHLTELTEASWWIFYRQRIDWKERRLGRSLYKDQKVVVRVGKKWTRESRWCGPVYPLSLIHI